MKWDDITNSFLTVVHHFLGWLDRLEAKDYVTFLPMLIALLAVFFGPVMTYRLGRRQIKMQEAIAAKQTETQASIAAKQVETQAAIAKRQIADSISAKRQNWIDELRKDMAEFLTANARLNELMRPAANLSEDDQRKNFEEMATNNFRAHELGIRIKLRLNPKEDKHNELDELLKKLSNVSKDPPPNETDDQKKAAIKAFNDVRQEVIAHMQMILKYEWERVKRGEV